MEAWVLALLTKPLAAILVIVVIGVLPAILVRMLRPVFPSGRLKDWLFRDRGSNRAAGATDTTQGVLNKPAVTVRQVGEDRPSL